MEHPPPAAILLSRDFLFPWRRGQVTESAVLPTRRPLSTPCRTQGARPDKRKTSPLTDVGNEWCVSAAAVQRATRLPVHCQREGCAAAEPRASRRPRSWQGGTAQQGRRQQRSSGSGTVPPESPPQYLAAVAARGVGAAAAGAPGGGAGACSAQRGAPHPRISARRPDWGHRRVAAPGTRASTSLWTTSHVDLSPAPPHHAPCAMVYLVTRLVGC